MQTCIELTRQERLRLWWCGVAATYGRRRHRFKRNALTFERAKKAGRLSPEKITELTRAQMTKVGKDGDRRSALVITDAVINGPASRLSMQQKGAALLAGVLDEHPDLRTIANIGARVDVTSSYLARRFPDRMFISVDLQPNLREHNARLPQSPNWIFVTGYALDLIERGEVRADAVFMTSTSVLFNSAELDAYLRAMGDAGVRAIVLNEPWWPAPRLMRPEEIDPDDPLCAGWYGNYHHNYPAKLTRAGYMTFASKIVIGDWNSGYAAIQIFAKHGKA
jgi:hypothetical protein